MSEDLNNVVPVNGLDDCIAQPPKDDAAAACSEQRSLNIVHAPSPSNVECVVSSEDGNHISAAASCIAPPSMDEAVQVVIPNLNIAGPSRSSDDKLPESVKTKKLVGYDRGLKAHRIIGGIKQNGKLMLLMAWKNSVDGEADLLDANEVYEKSPQLAIKFFEKKLTYCPPSEKRKNAKTQKRKNAKTQKRKNAKTQKRKNAHV